MASCGGRHFLLIFEMLAHESLANGILSHGYTHVRRGERHPRASKREGEYTSQRMWLVLPAAACFLWRSSKPPLHLAGDTLALCVFCMPLISPKVRSERRGLGASSGCCVPPDYLSNLPTWQPDSQSTNLIAHGLTTTHCCILRDDSARFISSQIRRCQGGSFLRPARCRRGLRR